MGIVELTYHVLFNRTKGSSSRKPRFRPSLEALENRLAPAVYKVTLNTDNDAVTAAGAVGPGQ